MRIGIVNDVALAVEALRRIVVGSRDHQVAWVAVDGVEAVRRAEHDPPDLILMDLVMPNMNGVEATRRIIARQNVAILIVTALGQKHQNMVYEAMSAGALDVVTTPVIRKDGEIDGRTALLEKIEQAGRMLGRMSLSMSGEIPPDLLPPADDIPPLLIIGSSTGGPSAVATILKALPADWSVGVVLVQHVDTAFAPGLAHWLDGQCKLPVRLVEPGQPPRAGEVVVAATNDHLIVTKHRLLRYTREPVEYPYRPSVNVFFESVAKHWPTAGTAVLLTGMGSDGAKGLLDLREAGWQTIAQDEGSSIVYGMPRAAARLGAADAILPVEKMAARILQRHPSR